MHNLYVVVATDKNNGIGKDGVMPWHLTKELKYFAKLTSTTEDPDKVNMVIMGKTTWLSLPEKYRPLKNRLNVVLSRTADFSDQGAIMAKGFQEAISLADENIESIFIIGGASIYKQAVEGLNLTGIYKTEIDEEFNCDTYFPTLSGSKYNKKVLSTECEKDLDFQFCYYSLKD